MEERRVAVVTGGSRGIGRAVVQRLAASGHRVFFNHFDRDDAAQRETEALAPGALGFSVNVADAAAVKSFFEAVEKEAGRLDVLVNNAGITRDGFLVRMKEEDWDAVVDVDLKGVFLCMKSAARIMMKRHWGRIVNVASVVGQAGNAAQANYAAAKAGVIGLTRAAARELAPRFITVNAVAPGFIETDMTAALPENARDSIVAQTPLKRMGTAFEVAAAVEFLAGDDAAFITGQVLSVNGGLHM